MSTRAITVRSCKECPFFVITTASLLLAFAKSLDTAMVGECDAPTESGVKHHPLGSPTKEARENTARKSQRLRVLDASKLPTECPLHTEDILVALGS